MESGPLYLLNPLLTDIYLIINMNLNHEILPLYCLQPVRQFEVKFAKVASLAAHVSSSPSHIS